MLMGPKPTRKADAIVIDSSSDSSQASEDSAPESDGDSPSKRGGYAAENDMSERQTKKINSGNFGMFNRPTLSARSVRASDSGDKRRKREKEYSDYREPLSSKKPREEGRDTVGVSRSLHEEEEDSGLFVRENSSQSITVSEVDNPEEDDQLYSDMDPERAQRVKEYLERLDLMERTEESLKAAKDELKEVATMHWHLSEELATVDSTAENEISDLVIERDEAIRLAIESADMKIRKIKDQLPHKKAGYEEKMKECDERKTATEERIKEAKAEHDRAAAIKQQLEQEGGFSLGGDVNYVLSQGRGRRK